MPHAPTALPAAAPLSLGPRPRLPLRKARHAGECDCLEQLPNIGVSLAEDLRLIGISHPRELVGQEPLALYQALSRATGRRQDPCVLDTFIAAVAFMGGEEPRPWWHYTAGRKERHGMRPPCGLETDAPAPH
jgi:hypothetical protein